MAEKHKETLGTRATRLRADTGLSRLELAERIGVTPPTLRNLERDLRQPGVFFVASLARALNVSIDYLVCVSDDLAYQPSDDSTISLPNGVDMTDTRLLSANDLFEITGKARYTKQAEWFKHQFGVDVARAANGKLVVTWATFEALNAKKNGLSTGGVDAGKVELCFD